MKQYIIVLGLISEEATRSFFGIKRYAQVKFAFTINNISVNQHQMMFLTILLTIGGVIIAIIIGNPIINDLRREHWRRQPFSTRWQQFLEQNVPIYRHLPFLLKQQLQSHIQVFLAEKQFIGCGGLDITEEMKLTIAAQACLLLLNRNTLYYKDLSVILVYPTAFIVPREVKDNAGVYSQERQVLEGESWAIGKIILSWEDVKQDTDSFGSGANVVLHEFAHQLDHEQGSTNGVPLLDSKASYITWAKVFSQAYQQHCSKAARGESTVMDYYGAKNPAEFFAVATEVFFEKPRLLKDEYGQLYEQLRNYYHVDPSEWSRAT
ncbi:hypothetical protein THII_0948 [Thioploca ingrica]|uniref:Zinc-dependent peptidase n=1 Tax=Thioploca ingrica TaxID=40754 RepID=A0A090AJV4_9GAMM|nr:hypothetical protein THII_0948 [Thioploca ingrica]